MNHHAFAGALLADNCPPGLRTWNGSDPAARFNVYRNNVLVALIEALSATFSVTRELVGVEFFNAMAREFARSNPPRSPVMTLYGIDSPEFAAFIADFPPARTVPYLSDMARLEAARILIYHADLDAPMILRSRFGIASLWLAHQDTTLLSTTDPYRAENALLVRQNDNLIVAAIADRDAAQIESLLATHNERAS